MAANKTAYTYNIVPNGSKVTENNLVHQTSPAWVLTFLRWKVRDTLRTEPTDDLDFSTIAEPLIVQNDCVQLGVNVSKSSLTPSMNATLLMTDVNYETQLSPGDFVFVNMLNWEQDASRVAQQARKLKPINGINDGFKGFFKLQSVRKALNTDPETGTKTYFVKITGFAFTEFNNSIYFNPYLLTEADKNSLLFASNIGIDWAKFNTDKALTKIQTVLQFLINSFVGPGFGDLERNTDQYAPAILNTHFFMPKGVDKLLGLPLVEAAKDTYNYLFGIQSYAATAQNLQQGMNPVGAVPGSTGDSRFIILPNPVEGDTVTKPEYWNQVKAWSILNQFTNSPLNELYTCFRVSPDGKILPTMVLRQIPFTNDNFKPGNYNVTPFMSVPRWNVHPALAFSFDLGKDEALRMNYVQYFGRSVNGPAGFDISNEIAQGNYVYDLDDVKRNGLRPYVVTSQFDRLESADTTYRSPGWAAIVGDALIGGHLKMSGTINFVGLPEPVAVGDNLQFDNVVYHIEDISHTCIQEHEGKKMFRTTITVSNGLDIASGNNVIYNEMKFGSAYDKRQADYDGTRILPGVSESQVRGPQHSSVDFPHKRGQSFIEPNTNTGVGKTTRDS